MKKLVGFLVSLLVGGLLICPSVADADPTQCNPNYDRHSAKTLTCQFLEEQGLEYYCFELCDDYYIKMWNKNHKREWNYDYKVQFSDDHIVLTGSPSKAPFLFSSSLAIVGELVFADDSEKFYDFAKKAILTDEDKRVYIDGVRCTFRLLDGVPMLDLWWGRDWKVDSTSVKKEIGNETVSRSVDTEPTPEDGWSQVGSWSGYKTTMNTEPFTIIDTPMKIEWSAVNDISFPGFFSIDIMKVKDCSLVEMAVFAEVDGSQTGVTYIYQKGTFYLDIGGTSLDWKVTLYEKCE